MDAAATTPFPSKNPGNESLIATAAMLDHLAEIHQRTSGKHDDIVRCHLHEALLLREKELGEAHPDTLKSMDRLADCWEANGNMLAALALRQRALTARESSLGTTHPSTLTSMQHLGQLLASCGANAAAKQLFEKVLDGRRRELGDEHPETGKILMELQNL